MIKLKYVKLFENFQFQYFKPDDIKKLNNDLYNNENFTYIDYLIEHWIEEFTRVIKSVEPFKNIDIEVDKYNEINKEQNSLELQIIELNKQVTQIETKVIRIKKNIYIIF